MTASALLTPNMYAIALPFTASDSTTMRDCPQLCLSARGCPGTRAGSECTLCGLKQDATIILGLAACMLSQCNTL